MLRDINGVVRGAGHTHTHTRTHIWRKKRGWCSYSYSSEPAETVIGFTD